MDPLKNQSCLLEWYKQTELLDFGVLLPNSTGGIIKWKKKIVQFIAATHALKMQIFDAGISLGGIFHKEQAEPIIAKITRL